MGSYIEKTDLNGEIHREAGPAIEDASGTKELWINGVRIR